MAQVDVLNVKGEAIGKLELKDEIFNVEPHLDVMYRYIDMQLTNRRQGTASTKNRAEITGGGRKPWSQKHTGRARHGSRRSPLWRHGAVVHGPKPREWFKKLPKKMKRLALKSALSVRYREDNLLVLDDIRFDAPRTKQMRTVLQDLNIADKKVLFVLPWKKDEYKNVKLSGRNIPNVKVIIADNPNNSKMGEKAVRIDGLNVYDIINHDVLVLTKDTVEKIEEVLAQ